VDTEELVVEKVLDVEGVKTFSIKGLVDVIRPGYKLKLMTDPIVVGAESGEIGSALISVYNDKIVGHFIINYSSPERLLLETNEKLYAAPSFRLYVEGDGTPVYELHCIDITATKLYSHSIPIGSLIK